MKRRTSLAVALALSIVSLGGASAVPLPEAKPTAQPAGPQNVDTTPAKQLFGSEKLPADLATRSIGFYAKGCLAGAKALPINGPQWQVMRLSRNRNWGHPRLIALLEDLAKKVPKETKWPGLLVGDISQPRGGPMLTGHASHQVGLDADVWLNPMPNRLLTAKEREDISAVSLVAKDWQDVDPKVWTPEHLKVIRLAARMPGVERIFVNPAIKKALCREATGDRSWLQTVRPFWGHNYHMHIRMVCPLGSANCKPQAPVPPGDGCDAALETWVKKQLPKPKPEKPEKPAKPKSPPPPMMLSDLPAECRAVVNAPDKAAERPPLYPASAKPAVSDVPDDQSADTPDPTGQETPVPPMPQ